MDSGKRLSFHYSGIYDFSSAEGVQGVDKVSLLQEGSSLSGPYNHPFQSLCLHPILVPAGIYDVQNCIQLAYKLNQ